MNQNGFSLPLVLITSSFFIALVLVLGASGVLLVEWAEGHHICRTQLLKIQGDLGHTIQELFALNPEAARLEGERLAAEEIMLTNPNPATEAMLLKIHAAQLTLAAKQQQILSQGKLAAERNLNSLKKSLQKISTSTFTDRAKISVLPVDPRSIAPEYELAPNFFHEQNIATKWTNRNPKGTSWVNQCAASLTGKHNGGANWNPVLSSETKRGR